MIVAEVAQSDLIKEIRSKNPGLAARVDKGSQGAAIRMQCLECAGGGRAEVETCGIEDCPLYLFRRNGRWEKKAKRTMTEEQRQAGAARLAAGRVKRAGGEG